MQLYAGSTNVRNVKNEYKFCIHIRRGDFIELGQASKRKFIYRSIAFLLPKLKVIKKLNLNNIMNYFFRKNII